MNIKALCITFAAAATISATAAESYRLKFPATVDIVEDGEVTGTKKLKAGTLVTLADADESQSAEEQKPAKEATAKGKLRLSKLSPIMFKNQRPAVAHVFNAEVKLSDYYDGPFRGKEGMFWNVRVFAYNSTWKSYELWQGYAKKTDAVGRQVKAMLEDGEEKSAHVKVSWVRSPDADDLVTIEAIEPCDRQQ